MKYYIFLIIKKLKNVFGKGQFLIRGLIFKTAFFVFTFLIMVMLVSCCLCFDSNSFLQDKKQDISNSTSKGDETSIYDTDTAETIPESSTPLIKPDLKVVSILKIPGQAIDVKAKGGYAYLTNDLGILYIIDVKDKKNPKIVGKCSGINSANIVLIQGDYAYVSYTDWTVEDEGGKKPTDSEKEITEIKSVCGFKIIDINDKKNPKIIGDYISGKNENKSVQGLAVDGDYAYLNSTKLLINSEESRLEIVDIKNKNNPKLTGSCIIDGQPNGIFVQGDYAYINNVYLDFKTKDYKEKSSFFVIDIKNKKKPEVIGSCEVPFHSWSIYVNGSFAYLSSNVHDEELNKYIESRLQIVDVSTPSSPVLKGSTNISGGAWEMDMKDNFLFISSLEGGVTAVDISETNSPKVVSILKTSGNSYDIEISGDYGYIADGFAGLVVISLQKEKQGEGLIIEDTGKESVAEETRKPDHIQENLQPVANLDVFGDRIFKDYYIEGNPVYFSAVNSYDPEGSDLDFKWEVNGEEVKDVIPSINFSSQLTTGYSKDYILSEDNKKLACFFSNPQKYKVKLTVSDGFLNDSEEIFIDVDEQNAIIEPIKEHNFTVIIECIIKNKSSIKLKNLECFIRTPQDYYPFQIVNTIKPSILTVDEIFDDDWNLLTHFKFNKYITVEKDKEFKASVNVNVTMYEYDFKKIQTKGIDYEIGDEDIYNYTKEDIYIDCNNPLIIDAAKKACGNEKDPVNKAKKIYNYVAKKLYYDFARAKEKNYKLMNASEILKLGKGVCADYSILYIALLRASGIPSRFVGGIPVTLILGQKNSQLDVGHAWVEVKLPGYGWIPIDITQEEGFMSTDYFLNLATEKGENYLYGSLTMDPYGYYFDGFRYKWDGIDVPNVEQNIMYRIKDLELKDIETIN